MANRHIGFTGTRQGMTRKQADECKELLLKIRRESDNYGTFFHHGDCTGADAEAHYIALELDYSIIIHPPTNQKMVANCKGNKRMEPKPYLERNHDIVDASTILIATPETEEEVLRSGTWATVRYARRQNKEVRILNP
jgi:predicted Rossmann fold nucleotide-binding protein DprA/Smf involved in DNA uptake